MTMNTLANLRDVAAGLPRGAMREGVLLRSEAPIDGDVPPSTIAWPPRTVIDLRHPLELELAHPLASSDTVVHAATLLEPSQPAPEGPGSRENLRGFYASLLEPPVSTRLAGIVEIVATAPDPILIHCLAGKDRTGVVVSVVLRLIGIERDDVFDEYLKTNDRATNLLARMRMHYARIDGHRAPARDISTESIKAPRELIVHIVDHWDAYDGETLGWYLDNGGTAEIAELLRERLLPQGGNRG
jgi:protein-tyrosine phosphatase